MRRWLLALALVTTFGCRKAPATSAPTEAGAPPTPAPRDAAPLAALIGTTPPAWNAERWANSPPLELETLRGSVVLVRWWTAGCPYCSATAPSLRTLHQTYGDRGLKVIGMYHHKEDTPFDPKVYEDTAKKYGFTFPLAFDPDWSTLKSWHHDRDGTPVEVDWTSVTFLLDKRGVIRHVHKGGSYVRGEPAYDEMTSAIERLLAE